MASRTFPELTTFPLLRRGKVRDVYDLGDHLLLVATDRLSAFDVVLPSPVPGKGVLLTQLSTFWFERTADIVPNHLADLPLAELRLPMTEQAHIAPRAVVARMAERIDVECVIRGYLAGSAWAEYRASGAVAGRRLPKGLALGSRLPEPLFTPAIKFDDGHDRNVSVRELQDIHGTELVAELEQLSLALYRSAAEHALNGGIILADTKLEFGRIDGEIHLIDEAFTPDSSRFWDAEEFVSGQDPPSFDKQFVRDWLRSTGWDGSPPGPALPREVVDGTLARYHLAFERLTGITLRAWLTARGLRSAESEWVR